MSNSPEDQDPEQQNDLTDALQPWDEVLGSRVAPAPPDSNEVSAPGFEEEPQDAPQDARETGGTRLSVVWEKYEFSPTVYLVTDSWGIVQDANRAAIALLKTSKSQLLGLSIEEFLPRSFRQTQWNELLDSLNHSEKWTRRLDLQATDQVIFPCSVKAVRFEQAGSAEFFWLWEVRDLSRLVTISKPQPPPQIFLEGIAASLLDVAFEVSTKPNLPARIESIADQIYEQLGINCLALYLYNPKLKELDLETAKGFPLTLNVQLQLGEGIIGKVALDRTPILLKETQIWTFRSPPIGTEEFTGAVVPMLSFEELIGVLCVGIVGDTPRRFGWNDVGLLTIFASAAALVATASRFHESASVERTRRKRAEAELKKALSQFQELSEKMEKQRVEERKSLSRDLHDDLGQLLTGFKMEVAQIAKSQRSVLEKLGNLADISDAGIEQIQEISADLRTSALVERGLVRAIEEQVQEFQSNSGIECKTTFVGKFSSVNQTVAMVLFRIVQEGLSNVARHAEASRVDIDVRETRDEIVLEIADNGRGIDESAVQDPHSLGLKGMRERAEAVRGIVEIVGGEGSGTAVIVHIPVGKSAKPKESER